MQLSLSIVVWCAVGGRQSLLGAMLGAIIVAGTQGALSESEAFLDTWTLIMGALFVLVVLLLPNGLAGLPRPRPVSMGQGSPVKRNRAAAKPKAGSAGGQMSTHLELQDVSVSFNGFMAVNGLNLTVNKGELRCLIGPTAPARRLRLT